LSPASWAPVDFDRL